MRNTMMLRRGAAIGALLLASGCGELPIGGGRNDSGGSAPGNSSQGPQAGAGGPAAGQCAPPANWGGAPTDAGGQNVLAIGGTGAMRWNGNPIELVQLRQYLDITATLVPTPLLILAVEPGAPCDRVNAAIETVSRSLNCSSLCSYRDGGALPARGAPGGSAPGPANQTEINLLQ